jgi:hypothetical protein
MKSHVPQNSSAIHDATAELRHGETLFYVEQQTESGVWLGAFAVLIGVLWVFFCIVAAVGAYMGNDLTPGTGFGIACLSLIGWFALYGGYYRFSIQKNYNFVTDKRIGLRGKGLFGGKICLDISVSSILSVTAKNERTSRYSFHTYIYVERSGEGTYVIAPWNAALMLDAIKSATGKEIDGA